MLETNEMLVSSFQKDSKDAEKPSAVAAMAKFLQQLSDRAHVTKAGLRDRGKCRVCKEAGGAGIPWPAKNLNLSEPKAPCSKCLD